MFHQPARSPVLHRKLLAPRRNVGQGVSLSAPPEDHSLNLYYRPELLTHSMEPSVWRQGGEPKSDRDHDGHVHLDQDGAATLGYRHTLLAHVESEWCSQAALWLTPSLCA